MLPRAAGGSVATNGTRILYGDVTPERAEEIYKKHFIGGEAIPDYIVYREDDKGECSGAEVDFLARTGAHRAAQLRQ